MAGNVTKLNFNDVVDEMNVKIKENITFTNIPVQHRKEAKHIGKIILITFIDS